MRQEPNSGPLGSEDSFYCFVLVDTSLFTCQSSQFGAAYVRPASEHEAELSGRSKIGLALRVVGNQ